jgi:hypothetical protein
MKNENITAKMSEEDQWRKKKIEERLKKSEKDGKFYTSDEVDKIIESFKLCRN